MRAVLALLVSACVSGQQPWDKYNFSPKSRTLTPRSIYEKTGCDPGTGGRVTEWGDNVPGQVPVPQLELACADGQTISHVAFASFGTPTGSCGTFQATAACHAPNSTDVVAALCQGRQTCLLPASPKVSKDGGPASPLVRMFGDPCPGTRKSFAVHIECSTSSSPSSPSSSSASAPSLASAIPGSSPLASSSLRVPLFPQTLSGAGARVVFDFGQEVGGFTSVTFGNVTPGATVSLAWSESTFYLDASDDSNGGSGHDGVLVTPALSTGFNYTVSPDHLRGGFRYLALTLMPTLDKRGAVGVKGGGSPTTVRDDGDGTLVVIDHVGLHFTPAPAMEDPSDYLNHFLSSDELVNQVWYGCAYTVQMCSIDPRHGRQWGPPPSGWNNSAICGVGDSVLVDGAKRDRTIWPGDMGVSTATAFATTGDTQSSLNSLKTLYASQAPDGILPYAGPPVSFNDASDTYHLWALVGTTNLAAFTGNISDDIWAGFQRGIAGSVKKIDPSTGLMVVDKKADWQRCCQGGKNIAANCLLYRALQTGSETALARGEQALAVQYATQGDALRAAINDVLWVQDKGAYRDNPTSDLFPQDGNSLAVWFNVTGTHPGRAELVSNYLNGNWGPFGSSSPEWDNNVGTFPGSMEVNAHMASGATDRGLDFIRLQWGYMLRAPNSTQSTFWEGYNADGTFNFKGIYMSNAHGWAAGAAPALSSYVLGIQPGKLGTPHQYIVAPQPGDLSFCLGRLHLAAGPVDVAWNVTSPSSSSSSAAAAASSALKGGEARAFLLRVQAPGQRGRVGIPLVGKTKHNYDNASIRIDGQLAWRGDRRVTGWRHNAVTLHHAGGQVVVEAGHARVWFDVYQSEDVTFEASFAGL